MKWSKFFIPTLKESPIGAEAVSHKLSIRAGLVHMLTSGVYSYLPLGLRVLKKIEYIIREEMNQIDAVELFMPCLHPLDIWKKTGRDQVLKDVMIQFNLGRGRDMCLGPTHEEIITDLVQSYVQSYKQLPVVLYQIQTKFRNELRTRFGIVRACEFIMKDAYSFDIDKAGMEKNYNKMHEAYKKIFKRCGLDVVIVAADSGAMGGDVSHEFMVPAPIGEDAVLICDKCDYRRGELADASKQETCPDCKQGHLTKQIAIELGHIFQLGTKYTQVLDCLYLDKTGTQKPIIMGCYGIGVSRTIAAIIETNHDDKGIIWPKEVAPFDIEILPIKGNDGEDIIELVEQFYEQLTSQGFDVLIDDRDESPGRKFNDADLIGIPVRIIIGKKNLVNNKIEVKIREKDEALLIDKQGAMNKVQELMGAL